MALSATEQEAVAARMTKIRDDLIEHFFTAFGTAGVKFDAESIQQQIVAELTKERRNLALKMMGFSDSWGSLEVDRANGRKTAASDFLERNAKAAVDKWIAECLLPTIEARSRGKLNNPAVMRAVMKDFDDIFFRAAERRMHDLAVEAGENFAHALVDQMKASMKLAQD